VVLLLEVIRICKGQGVQLTEEPKSPAFNMELLAAEETSVAA
jgi:hypothetical protein